MKKIKVWHIVLTLIVCPLIVGIILKYLPTNDNLDTPKTTNYNTFIQDEIAGKEQINLVSDEEIKEFFLRFQLSLSEKRNSISNENLKTLPYYLQRPYDMIITISTTHGLGFVFVAPSDNPQIDITKTDMPIEKYYFSKYTTEENISKAKIVRNAYKFNTICNLTLVGGKQMTAIESTGDILLQDVWFKYSKDDSVQKIPFLRVFGNNQKDFWEKIDPYEQANWLFEINFKINSALETSRD